MSGATFETIKEGVFNYIKERFPASKVPDNEDLVADDVTNSELAELHGKQVGVLAEG